MGLKQNSNIILLAVVIIEPVIIMQRKIVTVTYIWIVKIKKLPSLWWNGIPQGPNKTKGKFSRDNICEQDKEGTGH